MLIVLAIFALAPTAASTFTWKFILPDFESSEILPGLLFLATGVAYQSGDDFSFECIKQRCPAESLACLLDAGCRNYVRALSFGVDGAGDGCSRELTREALCGISCSRAVVAFSACSEGPGRDCVFSTDGMPVVVHRNALDESELQLIASLALAQQSTPGNHQNRTFGTTDGTTGHVVTWLTPAIHEERELVSHLFGLARSSVAAGGWRVRDFDGLKMRCAELLEYGGGGAATGLGWHWDVGSTLTMVTMLHASANSSSGSEASGELQLSTNCTITRLPLQRGDVAVYRSRHRHRVTTVTQPRTVLAVEWWRGDQTNTPSRPPFPGKRLVEPPPTEAEEAALAAQPEEARGRPAPLPEGDVNFAVEL